MMTCEEMMELADRVNSKKTPIRNPQEAEFVCASFWEDKRVDICHAKSPFDLWPFGYNQPMHKAGYWFGTGRFQRYLGETWEDVKREFKPMSD